MTLIIQKKGGKNNEKIKYNQQQPSEELLEKVRLIAYTKSLVSLAFKGEFNKFGVYVQSKDIFDQNVSKTIYMAGGKFIPKLTFSDVDKKIEIPEEVFEDLDFDDPDYFDKLKQRREEYFNKNKDSESETIVNKYEPGDWEKRLDLLYKFTQEFQDKHIGKDYP